MDVRNTPIYILVFLLVLIMDLILISRRRKGAVKQPEKRAIRFWPSAAASAAVERVAIWLGTLP